MKIKEDPEDERLHHQLSTESRWTGQGTLAKRFLISLSQAVTVQAFCMCEWQDVSEGVWDEGERLKEATEYMGWCTR